MSLFDTLSALTTESINPRTVNIDALPTLEVVQMLHEEDQLVNNAVRFVLPEIALAIDALVHTLGNGMRMVYVGAGTSGRLGILDASEMPPTFGVDAGLISGIIAGGSRAVFESVEGAEDDPNGGAEALRVHMAADIRAVGMVVGLSASGRTPFVLGALEEASRQGMLTVLLSTNEESLVRSFAPFVSIRICPFVGPEPIAGSTRMKSGTAQKMVINMITTGAMVRLGKTYGNVMVDLRPTNEKLRLRAVRTVHQLGGVTVEAARELLDACAWDVKVAMVMARRRCSTEVAQHILDEVHGRLRLALDGNESSAEEK